MTTKHLALIVDDEPDIRDLLELTLNRMDINTVSAGDLQSANKLLNENKISICLADMRLPDGNGIELVKTIQAKFNHIPVAMISAHGNMDTAIEALKAGAFDFVSKPVDLAELRNLVKSAVSLADQIQQEKTPENIDATDITLATDLSKQVLIGASTIMAKARKLIDKLAKSQAPVYISGESGTGKEIAARQIHNLSTRKNAPFIPVNCGAIPTELMESEFFGHRKGSFSGATSHKQGLFQAAQGGTLFLDEIAELPLSMQVTLLRALQEKAVRAVGSQQEEKINVRIISATNEILKQRVDNGQFRQDLYYRINVIELSMPPLRQRNGDIIELAQFFLHRLSSSGTYSLSENAIKALENYTFPGNVRELENILERSVALCDGHTIDAADLALPQPEPEPEPSPNFQNNYLDQTNNLSSNTSLSLTREHLVTALEQTHWNRKAAAESLGITYRQFRYRIKKLGLE